MAILNLGKIEVGQQSGTSGTTSVGVKYTQQHTGRNPWNKQFRGICGSAQAVETVTISGKPQFMNLLSNSQDVAWNVTSASVTVKTNSEKFRISSSGKEVTLQSSASYTVNGKIGEFTNNLGAVDEHDVVITFSFVNNTTPTNVSMPILIEVWNGTSYVAAGTYTVMQSSADSDIQITTNPVTLPIFDRTASSKTISVTSNANYSIEKQGSDIAWFTLSKTSGGAGTESLEVSVTAQIVAAAQRTGSIVFKNPISGSTILTLEVTQQAGEAYSITITPSTITFQNTEINVIKNVEVKANSSWHLEEVVS